MVGRWLKRYFNSWWLPLLLSLVNLTVLMVLVFPLIGTSGEISFAFFAVLIVLLAGLAISFLGLLGSLLWSLLRQRWIKLFSDALMLCFFLGAAYLSLSLLLAAAMNVGEENFSYRASTDVIGMIGWL